MPRSRRSTLRSSVTATATGLVGCLGFGGTNETVAVHVDNESSTAHEVTASVTFEGDSLFERTVALDAGESESGSFENPETVGSARVEATLEDGSPTTDPVRVGPGTGIRSITIRIPEREVVEIRAGRT
ncbi:hypothetical protein ACFPM1_12980 [Halorubrum rubrum]|uniref:Ig-like domain-containing protein n=1 Tax=Halorubrum rubrum TaxID=1126240 RepID=A0ABD5R474_9EURY|nr:hypothetical protein [Halorubrum rubrum]